MTVVERMRLIAVAADAAASLREGALLCQNMAKEHEDPDAKGLLVEFEGRYAMVADMADRMVELVTDDDDFGMLVADSEEDES
jgi:hypothetical protein